LKFPLVFKFATLSVPNYLEDHLMSGKQTHVDILVSRIASHGAEPFFKAVRKDATGGLTWDVTTYAKFGRDIDALSVQLRTVLQRDGVQDGAVVGVWCVMERTLGHLIITKSSG
jgi:hypothetical protein